MKKMLGGLRCEGAMGISSVACATPASSRAFTNLLKDGTND